MTREGAQGLKENPGVSRNKGGVWGTRNWRRGPQTPTWRVSAHAKLGESVSKAEWWVRFDKRRGLLRKGGAPPTGAELRRKRRSLEGRGFRGAGIGQGRSVTVCALVLSPAPGVPVTRQGRSRRRPGPSLPQQAPGPSRGEE